MLFIVRTLSLNHMIAINDATVVVVVLLNARDDSAVYCFLLLIVVDDGRPCCGSSHHHHHHHHSNSYSFVSPIRWAVWFSSSLLLFITVCWVDDPNEIIN